MGILERSRIACTFDRLSSVRLGRCGGSANKPYCDGSHRHNGFRS
jgi:CDGSH-type Zn-finger protein